MAEHDDAPEDQLSATDVVALEPEDVEPGAAEDTDDLDPGADTDRGAAGTEKSSSSIRMATLVGLVIVVVAGALVGVLGYRAFQSQQTEDRTNLFLGVARQGAINLTTIDWQAADSDVQRILDSATGTFYDDFSKRSGPFVEVVKQAQSKSVGTVTEAGLESETKDQAQVLVAVSVKTSNRGANEEQPRQWRMRIDVQKMGDDVKVSNVQFVP